MLDEIHPEYHQLFHPVIDLEQNEQLFVMSFVESLL